MNNSDYEALVSISTGSSLEDKIANYTEAIEIYPDRTDAYLKMLEAYQDEGLFGKAQNDEFLAVYNSYKSYLDSTDPAVAELNYRIGMLYFNYYVENDFGEYSFSTRVQKAYPFFAENYNNGIAFESRTMSDCYYRVCSFYKKYILNTTTVEEASGEDYSELISVIETTVNTVASAGAYDQLTFYNSVFLLMYDQRTGMAQVNVDMQRVLDLYDTIHYRTSELVVQKEQSRKLQDEILNNYDNYRSAIERAFINLNERK